MQTSLKINRRLHSTRLWPLNKLTAIVTGVLVAAFLVGALGCATTREPAIPRGAPLASWNENGRGGHYALQIMQGSAPPAGVTVAGVVLSDTNCQPDGQGFNHCHNEINLANGERITVINTHVMRIYRCLRPGEPISLTRIDASWVLAKVS